MMFPAIDGDKIYCSYVKERYCRHLSRSRKISIELEETVVLNFIKKTS